MTRVQCFEKKLVNVLQLCVVLEGSQVVLPPGPALVVDATVFSPPGCGKQESRHGELLFVLLFLIFKDFRQTIVI